MLLEERLAGACTTEVAAFDEFASLLTEENTPAALDHVIFDTAPTGHTLRLLELPAAWAGFLETDAAEASCVGPLSALTAQRARYARTVAALGDPSQTLLVLVARPDRVALLEAARAGRELGEIGMRNQFLLLNAIFRASDPSDALARALEERGRRALSDLPAALRELPSAEVLLHGFNLVGLDALRAYFSPSSGSPPDPRPIELPAIGDLSALIDEIAIAPRGLVLVMGKGGVGKTTIAASIAVALASRGHRTHLTTTDPAAHLGETLEAAVPGLQVSRIATPEQTPVLEAKALQEDLRRAGIEPFAWVINGSLAAAAPRDPLLLERARAELAPIRMVVQGLAQRLAIVPFLAEEPVGAARLLALAGSPTLSAS